jgi:hypothetical protein
VCPLDEDRLVPDINIFIERKEEAQPISSEGVRNEQNFIEDDEVFYAGTFGQRLAFISDGC